MSGLFIDGTLVLEDPALVLFDKDGTLIDIHHYWVSMIRIRSALIVKRWFQAHSDYNEIELELIDAMGVDLLSSRMKPEGPVGVKPRPFIVNVVSELVRGKGLDLKNEGLEELFTEVDNSTAENLLPLLKLLPGVEILLQQLQSCNVKIAIVSTDITSRARKAMEALGLSEYFFSIIGGDTVKNTKPAPDLAEMVLKQDSFQLNKTVVIGDHPVDIHMGINAGIDTNIGVLTGLSDHLLFENLKCEVVSDLTTIEIRC